jgi:hypothetical protein
VFSIDFCDPKFVSTTTPFDEVSRHSQVRYACYDQPIDLNFGAREKLLDAKWRSGSYQNQLLQRLFIDDILQ